MYLQRSPALEAQIHSNQQYFSNTLNHMNNLILDLQDEVFRLTGENVTIKTTLNDILARLDGPSDNVVSRPAPKTKGITNKHPDLKSAVHAMFWRLLSIDPDAAADERHTKMCDGHDGEDAFTIVNTPTGAETKIWKPNYSLAVNTQKNKKFINEIVERVHEAETIHRKSNQGKLPDISYDKAIIKSVAQTYFGTIASNWKKMNTPEGKKKLENEAEKKKLHNRRQLVTAARQEVVEQFEVEYEVSGAAALLDTDFASSVVSLNESTISETTRKRRKAQGGRKGDWMVVGKNWRRKSYVRFLRELDRFVKLKIAATKKQKEDEKKLNESSEPA
ncbi:hypothetical protein MVEN_00081900 [Mycena venus]|uniref:Uncharacterized protein n=1 Tax=Mycena venus TaxID=2733690 RepID=A0A8H6Z752_9AGAR|nr:hypothetical protein MVEN_00081900 [Mycena venus]